ncbi:conserved hypothetical protein, partial [Ricinus communis]
MPHGAGRRKQGDLAGQGVDQQMLRLAHRVHTRPAFAGFDQDEVEQQPAVQRQRGEALEHAEPARPHADEGDA